jgi:hypothetical protein
MYEANTPDNRNNREKEENRRGHLEAAGEAVREKSKIILLL